MIKTYNQQDCRNIIVGMIVSATIEHLYLDKHIVICELHIVELFSISRVTLE